MFLNVLDSAVFESFFGFLQDTIYTRLIMTWDVTIRNRQVTLNEQVSSMTMHDVTKLQKLSRWRIRTYRKSDIIFLPPLIFYARFLSLCRVWKLSGGSAGSAAGHTRARCRPDLKKFFLEQQPPLCFCPLHDKILVYEIFISIQKFLFLGGSNLSWSKGWPANKPTYLWDPGTRRWVWRQMMKNVQ